MLIAGFSKLSLVDFPGTLAAVVFVPYCNMRCWYCHNAQILSGDFPLIPEEAVFDFLEKRANVLKGVVVTGGEPTLRPDLPLFLEKIKKLGYLIKLDTNGANPRMLAALIGRKLVDYAAMDVKAPEAKYREIAGTGVNMTDIKKSIALLMQSGIPYEFRTTFAPTLAIEDILAIADLIPGAQAYYLQQYRPVTPKEGDAPMLAHPPAHPPQYVRDTAARMKERLGVCETRGLLAD